MAKDCIPPIIASLVKDGKMNVFACGDGTVYSSSNGYSWMPYLSFNDVSSVQQMKCYGQANARAMFAYDGEHLYYTDYSYDLVNDYPEFTATSALALYEEHKDEIALSISTVVSSHIDAMHTPMHSATSLSDLNSCMPVDFSLMPADFGRSGDDGD